MSRLRHALDRLGPTLRQAVHLRPAQLVAFARHRAAGPARAPEQSRGPGCDAAVIPEGFAGISPEGTVDDDGGVRLVGHGPHDPLRVGWDAGDDPLWAYTLHYHGWLSRFDVDQGRATILDWIEEHRRGVGWEPYPTSLRVLHWLGWLGAHGGSLHSGQLEIILASIAAQLRHLLAHVEIHLDGNHLWTNWAALTAAAFALEGELPAQLRAHAPDRLLAIVGDQLAADGVHRERTPSYHCLLAEQLFVVAALADRRAPQLAAAFRGHAVHMRGATAAFMHPDGDVALWGDSQLGAPVPPRSLFARDGLPLPIGHATASDSGFARRAWGPFTLLWNQGGVGMAHQVGHIHADGGSIELSHESVRVLVDGGVGTYADGPDRDYCRSTAAHNTVTVDGRDQHELWRSHRIGGRARLGPASYQHDRITAALAGFRSKCTHRREIAWDGEAITICDRVGNGGRGVLRWFVPAASSVRAIPDGALVFLPRGATIELRIHGAAVRSEPAPGWTAMGTVAPRTCISADVGAGPVTTTIRALR